MSGTLVTNFVQPDLNTDLTLNQRNSTGNTVAIGALYAGQNANTPLAGATNPTIGSIQSANNYIQNYVYNTANGSFSSADFTAYPNNGSDASGWVDMGITSNNYSQATYSVTGRNEGYVLMSAPSGSGTSGNLVIGTDSTGAYNSIQVYTKGFAQSKANAVVTIDGATGAMSTAQPISVPNTFGFKNRLINGNMSVWQRGTSLVTTTAAWNYFVDRFAVYSAGASATWGQNTSVPQGFQYSLKMQRTASQTYTNLLYAAQIIETVNCLDLAGQTITFSFWAKAGANFSASGSNINVYLATGTGTDEGLAAFGGGTWTGFTAPVNQTQVITTTWTKYSYTVTLGSTVSELGVQLSFTPVGTAGADDSLYITGLQVEKGSVATPFDVRPYGTELQLCQRYLPAFNATTGSADNVGSAYAPNSTTAQCFYQFVVTPRVPPTGLTCPNAAKFTYYSSTATYVASAITFTGAGLKSASMNFTVSGAAAGAGAVVFANATPAQILFTGCEL